MVCMLGNSELCIDHASSKVKEMFIFALYLESYGAVYNINYVMYKCGLDPSRPTFPLYTLKLNDIMHSTVVTLAVSRIYCFFSAIAETLF